MTVLTLCIPFNANSELYFAPELLGMDEGMVADLTVLQRKGAQLPGLYLVDIYVNDQLKTNKEIKFIRIDSYKFDTQKNDAINLTKDETGLIACLTIDDLESFGVNTKVFLEEVSLSKSNCIAPGEFIRDAYTSFNFETMRLNVSIPQAAMNNDARGYISPNLWDDGINAALLNYNVGGNTSKLADGSKNYSAFANLTSGVNFGPWRIRDQRVWNSVDNVSYNTNSWQHIKTYAERAIVSLRSSFVVGDSITGGNVFESLGFRGVQISTEDNMYPDSQRGFAPIIRGNASTNAQVNITQNGYIVYQTFVTPGAFVINDLFPVFSSGDLEVTVKEADGRINTFTVPYSSVPLLQREGKINYSLTMGKLRSVGKEYYTPEFIESTLLWGLPHNVTGYGGIQYSKNYLSGILGTGFNLGYLGALSLDVTHAESTLSDGSNHKGQSLRFLYARSLNSLGTTFQLTGYRYSTLGFYTLADTALRNRYDYNNDTTDSITSGNIKNHLTDKRRAKVEASISQKIGPLGSMYLNGMKETYWNSQANTTSLQVGLNGTHGTVNYNLSYSHSKATGFRDSQQVYMLSLSVPFSSIFSMARNENNSTYLTYNSTRNSEGELTQQTGLSGTALEGNNLNWNLSQGYSRSNKYSGNVGMDYRGSRAGSNIGYSYSKEYKQMNYGLSGGVVLHEEGITFGQQMGETSVLIAAPGVAGVDVENETGIRTDSRGYAIKPYASIYRENRIALDTASLNDNTDIEEAVSRVVPTRGAVVRASFKGHTGSRVLFKIIKDGQPLPFGTMVSSGERTGIVGDEGLVYLSGMKPEGFIHAEWGKGKQCKTPYRLSDGINKGTIVKLDVVCL
ncbi:fimbria/pilus outer membrane usher protein [Enterobacter hormaechei]